MKQNVNNDMETIHKPHQTPFLKALCWHGENPNGLNPEDTLAIYERGWRFKGVLAEPTAEEQAYIKKLAHFYQSWLQAAI